MEQILEIGQEWDMVFEDYAMPTSAPTNAIPGGTRLWQVVLFLVLVGAIASLVLYWLDCESKLERKRPES